MSNPGGKDCTTPPNTGKSSSTSPSHVTPPAGFSVVPPPVIGDVLAYVLGRDQPAVGDEQPAEVVVAVPPLDQREGGNQWDLNELPAAAEEPSPSPSPLSPKEEEPPSSSSIKPVPDLNMPPPPPEED
ncbi:unnamed protein product [Camellia sinensis]